MSTQPAPVDSAQPFNPRHAANTNLQESEEPKRFPPSDNALEPHYTVQQVSQLWHLDEKMVRKIFRNEPGVVSLRLGRRAV